MIFAMLILTEEKRTVKRGSKKHNEFHKKERQ